MVFAEKIDRGEPYAALKQEDGPELQVYGSGNLAQTLRLVDSIVSKTGVFMGTYEPAGEVVTGSF